MAGDLTETIISGGSGYEDIVLTPATIERAPAPLRNALRDFRIHSRRLSNTELLCAGLLAGAGAEVAKVLLLHPLDTAKTRLQARRGAGAGSGDRSETPPQLFANPYAGIVPALLTAAPQQAAFFVVRDAVQLGFCGPLLASGRVDDFASALIALTAGELAYWTVRTPSDAIKLKRQLEELEAAQQQQQQEEEEEEEERRARMLVDYSRPDGTKHPMQGGARVTNSEVQFGFAPPPPPRPPPAPDPAVRLATPQPHPAVAMDATLLEPDPKADESSALERLGAEAQAVLRLGASAYPISVLAELPPVLARAFVFGALYLRAGGAASLGLPSSLLADEGVYVVIACVVALVCTPLDVWRTRTLQQLVLAEAGRGGGATAPGRTSTDSFVRDAPVYGADTHFDLRRSARFVFCFDMAAGATGTLVELIELTKRDGPSVLLKGAVPRVLWNGIVVGGTLPLRATGYLVARDSIILTIFDTVAGSGADGRSEEARLAGEMYRAFFGAVLLGHGR